MFVRLFLPPVLRRGNLNCAFPSHRCGVVAALILCALLLGPVETLSSGEIEIVRSRIHAWSKAWQSQDIDAYMFFYSPSFHSDGVDYLGWGLKKTELFQEARNISVTISDLWVLIEGQRAIARFVQEYQRASYLDVGEKELILEKKNSYWKIVSETWKPLTGKRLPQKGRAVSESPLKITRRNPDADKKGQSRGGERVNPAYVAVESIKFEVQEQGEKVFIDLNSFSIPVVFNLEGSKPRIVIDVMKVSSWNGKSRIPDNGKLIRQIRTYLHKDTGKLRIVLDLEASEDYFVTQTYYNKGNIYCIQVN